MEYQICNRCVMDTSDSQIRFDEQGICNHCRRFDEITLPYWKQCTKEVLDGLVYKIKQESRNKEFDVIIGLSGGVDSSYLLHYIKKEYDLRILAVHVDAGWNSSIATQNIQALVDKLDIKLHTITIDLDEMRDLQVAFLRSGVVNCDVPQDHAFFASLYQYATKHQIRYVLNGANYATESVFPFSWAHFALDSIQLKDIHHKFGKRPLKQYPIVSFFDYYFYYPFIKKMHVLSPLNYIPYNKQKALQELGLEYGWQGYGDKHCESVWTKFFQTYFLPTKFGYDKRRPHFSSLILSGEMQREQAIEQLKESPYKGDFDKDLSEILNHLQLSEQDWQEIMQSPIKSYRDYANNEKIYQFKKKFLDKIIS
ncbi:hypothetical protein CCZ01_09680 [Helicobacter monodelphidis]|uniref:N-acetyl sugar amidotransferase n=1 Tax=Helicobacter sp. 15-1451 TaxID=2004995 RepID=UPI000DCB3072|nr:N-acetyl sugar amidotransferase [Helicobacter sp. 15-1451]RAX56385.1 hypothetical protein CCZ01_09680 [Helicobacter sp. 15-1451]